MRRTGVLYILNIPLAHAIRLTTGRYTNNRSLVLQGTNALSSHSVREFPPGVHWSRAAVRGYCTCIFYGGCYKPATSFRLAVE